MTSGSGVNFKMAAILYVNTPSTLSKIPLFLFDLHSKYVYNQKFKNILPALLYDEK